MRAGWLVAIALCASCIDAALVSCPDGRACPKGTACDVVHATCVAPDQLTACEALPELATCTATGVANGRCFDQVCLPAGCGNGFTEPGELCDDANLISGDGCSIDCLSRELCGDGFVDKARGEECDDGNQTSRDGCTPACTIELPLWVEAGALLPPRHSSAVAYDLAHDRLLLFGGEPETNVALSDTWSVEGNTWTFLSDAGPVQRRYHAMTYAPGLQRVVLFGGFSTRPQSFLLNDTWEWTGTRWIERRPFVMPSARLRPGMAWDGERVILFGGTQFISELDDTWAWDGEIWTRLALDPRPPARESPSMTYDAKHDRLVMFGGLSSESSIPRADTWLFAGGAWTQLATTPSPPPMSWHGIAYDAHRGVVVLTGVTSVGSVHAVWELDGSTWSDRTPAVPPESIIGASVTYDFAARRVVRIAGLRTSNNMPSNASWEWDGTAWTPRGIPVMPESRDGCALASDPLRGRLVMFGGSSSTGWHDDTWAWTGRKWIELAVNSPPPERTAAGMAHDGENIVLFGGATNTAMADTWTFDGALWSRRLVTGPSARFGPAMAYDSTRDVVVLFGGTDAVDGAVAFDDTWEWDGAAWTRRTPTTSPPGRMFARLAYDIERRRMVLFAGAGPGLELLDDTWEWDGTTWTELQPTVRPDARANHGLVYDRARKRVVTFGGLPGQFSQWEWDGAAWNAVPSQQLATAKHSFCAAYDDAHRELVTFGGRFLSQRIQVTGVGAHLGDVDEQCEFGHDLDGDGTVGCADADCVTRCAPTCWAQTSCTASPGCGDLTCSTLESDRLCASDCGAAATGVCGDAYCSTDEDCAADCP